MLKSNLAAECRVASKIENVLSFTGIMVEVTVKIPAELADSFGETPEARAKRIIEDAAIEEYRKGGLSHRQVGELLQLDYWQTEEFFKERKVPLNYSVKDLEQDRATLDALLNNLA